MNVTILNTIFYWIAIFSAFFTLVSSVGTFWTGKIMERPRVELRPMEINIENQNPEIGHDSEYELNIVTQNPISNFLLTVRVPNSVWEKDEMFSLFNDPAGGNRTWYPYTIKNGYATFEISNAAGKYHLTFGNIKPEELTIKDVTW